MSNETNCSGANLITCQFFTGAFVEFSGKSNNSGVFDYALLNSSFNIFTSEIVKAVWECDLKGLPRINFLGAKVLEMMASTLSTYQKDIIRNRHKGLKPEEYDAISLIANRFFF